MILGVDIHLGSFGFVSKSGITGSCRDFMFNFFFFFEDLPCLPLQLHPSGLASDSAHFPAHTCTPLSLFSFPFPPFSPPFHPPKLWAACSLEEATSIRR